MFVVCVALKVLPIRSAWRSAQRESRVHLFFPIVQLTMFVCVVAVVVEALVDSVAVVAVEALVDSVAVVVCVDAVMIGVLSVTREVQRVFDFR